MAHCLTHEELYLRYQPIYSLVSREITGMEALLRWRHKELGEVLVPELAELCRLGRRLGMNLSRPVQASDDESRIDMWVETRLVRSGEEQLLDLEITESLLILESDN